MFTVTCGEVHMSTRLYTGYYWGWQRREPYQRWRKTDVEVCIQTAFTTWCRLARRIL